MSIPNLLGKLGYYILAISRRYQFSSIPGTISIGSRVIHDLEPLGGFRSPGLTKAGRLSFRGVCDGRPVKVYSAFSQQQVALRLAVQAASFDGFGFPEVIAADDQLIVEPWISGVPVAALQGKELKEAQHAIGRFLASFRTVESEAIADANRCSFDYIDDYLIPRLGSWVHLDQIKAFLQSWRNVYATLEARIPARLSHPDLSAANVIRESGSGRLLVIDNELLGVGRGWILDGRNSFARHDEMAALDDHQVPISFVEQTWRLRQLGSALDAGRLLDIPDILNS